MGTPAFAPPPQSITALFVRIGPPAGSETLPLINQGLTQLPHLIQQGGGKIEATVGDSLLVTFPGSDAPTRAVQTALALREKIEEFNSQFVGEGACWLTLRQGISSGEVFRPGTGSLLRQVLSIVGPPIDEASQLKTAAGPGQILVTRSVYRAVLSQFMMEDLPAIRLTPDLPCLDLYQVVGRRKVPWEPVTLRAPLIGRDAELSLLQRRLLGLVESRGGGVFIVGKPGLGKSRLVAELRKWGRARGWLRDEDDLSAGDAPRILWLETRGLPAESRPGSLLSPIICGCLGCDEDHQTPLVGPAGWHDLREAIQRRWPERLVELLPYLANLLVLPVEDRSLRERLIYLDAATLRHRTERALRFLLEKTAAERPLVIVFDDLHWADPYSLALLSGLISLASRAPLLWIGALEPQSAERPVSRFTRQARKNLPPYRWLYLVLNSLTSDASAQLVHDLLLENDLPAVSVKRILKPAGGNPFFIEELLRGLIERQELVLVNNTWRMVKEWDPDQTLIATVRSATQRRLLRLPEEARRTAQVASVIGRFFQTSILEELLPLPPAEIQAHLDRLEQATVIRSRPGGEYVFHHTLTQKASYRSLSSSQAKRLHAQVGDTYRRIYAETPQTGYELLAYHYGRSEKLELGLEYARLAGDKNRDRDGYSQAQRFYAQAQALAEQLADEPAAIDMIIAQAGVRRELGDLPAAVAGYRMALERAKAIQSASRQISANEQLSFIGCLQGDRNSALKFASRAHELTRSLEPDNPMAGSWNHLGAARQLRCEYRDAIYCHQQAIAQAKVTGNVRLIATSHNNLGNIYRALGEGERALSHFRALIRRAGDIRDRRLEALALSNAAGAYLLMGRVDEAEDAIRHALRIAELIGVADLVEPHLFLSRAHLARGSMAQAWDSAARARQIAETAGRPEKIGIAQRVQGEIAAAAKAAGIDLLEAKSPADYFRASLRTLRPVQELEWGYSLLAYGRYLDSEERQSEAERYLTQASAVFQRLNVEQ